MNLNIVGPTPFVVDPTTGSEPKVATLFLRRRTLITTFPAVHAFQRRRLLDQINEQREKEGRPPLSGDEEAAEIAQTVGLFCSNRFLLIRPLPEQMDLALEADEQLQELVPKHRIRFLHAKHPSVRDALRTRGELWRISQPPQTVPEMQTFIRQSLVAIGGQAIYRINRTTGTRWLTLQQLRDLAKLSDADLAGHLAELAKFSTLLNRAGFPELCFIPKCEEKPALLTNTDFQAIPAEEVRRIHAELVKMLEPHVPLDLRWDDPKNAVWRNTLFNALTEEPEGTLTEDVVGGLGEAFYRQVLWLPGGRFEHGELIFDPTLELSRSSDADQVTRRLCDNGVKGFILNFLRAFGELEYVNVGRVVSAQTTRQTGRRAVYVAEIKPRLHADRVLRIIRLQRWGIREHLDEGDDLLSAILKAHEYTHYVLDRRLGCRQLGMQIPLRMSCWDILEDYRTADGNILEIWVTYFERDYFAGTAANQISDHKLAQPEYALRLGRLLGKAAAPNLIVGKAEEFSTQVVFDVGDEVVVENEQGLPVQIVICDHSRSFGDYRTPLGALAGAYARPVNNRLALVPEPRQFAEAYLASFEQRLTEIRSEYLARKNAYRQLFQHLPVDEAGSFGFRWLAVLDRLEHADPAEIVETVRRGILL